MRQKAVALQYKNSDELPKVLAAGAGEIAKEILRLAESFGIPVREDSDLTNLLSKLDPGSTISPEAFEVVAEILCFLYHVDKEWQKAHPQVGVLIDRKDTKALPSPQKPNDL